MFQLGSCPPVTAERKQEQLQKQRSGEPAEAAAAPAQGAKLSFTLSS